MDNNISSHWRLFLFAFTFLAGVVAYFDDPINDTLDLLLPKPEPTEFPPLPKSKGRPVPPSPKTLTRILVDPEWHPLPNASTLPFLYHDSLVCLKAKKTPHIDGSIDDWDLRAGYLYANNYRLETGKQNAWVYTMFDEKYFYLFYRIRDRFINFQLRHNVDDIH
ncbi:MAG: hypothetical protein D6820_08775, partial [Lentisphaerae bacterium]